MAAAGKIACHPGAQASLGAPAPRFTLPPDMAPPNQRRPPAAVHRSQPFRGDPNPRQTGLVPRPREVVLLWGRVENPPSYRGDTDLRCGCSLCPRWGADPMGFHALPWAAGPCLTAWQAACRLATGTRGDCQSPRRMPSCPTEIAPFLTVTVLAGGANRPPEIRRFLFHADQPARPDGPTSSALQASHHFRRAWAPSRPRVL